MPSHTHLLHHMLFQLDLVSSSLISDSHRTLQLNCIIHCIFRMFSVSFSASRTHLSFISRLSPASSPIRLSSPAPSPLSSPTLYPTLQHSTTPRNTLLTRRHPHSHQADLTQSSHIIHRSLSISHHPTASFHLQTTDLQTSAFTYFHPLHFTITASPLHDRFQSTAPMLHPNRSLKIHYTHPTQPTH